MEKLIRKCNLISNIYSIVFTLYHFFMNCMNVITFHLVSIGKLRPIPTIPENFSYGKARDCAIDLVFKL